MQSALGKGLPAQRGVPTILGVPLTRLGGTLSGPVVYQDNALEDRTYERSRPDATRAPGAFTQLVPC